MFSIQMTRMTMRVAPVLLAMAMAPPLMAQQITVTAAPAVSALMAACTPIDAQGPAIRDQMMERGWTPVAPEDQSAVIPAFSAALFWSFMPNLPPTAREGNFDQLVAGVTRAANSEGASFLSDESEFILILWNGDSLSCIWAGPQTEVIDTLAVQLGGFPESDGVATAGIQQRVEAGGRDWARGMSVGRTPVEDLPEAVAGSGITDSARLDRSPL